MDSSILKRELSFSVVNVKTLQRHVLNVNCLKLKQLVTTNMRFNVHAANNLINAIIVNITIKLYNSRHCISFPDDLYLCLVRLVVHLVDLVLTSKVGTETSSVQPHNFHN